MSSGAVARLRASPALLARARAGAHGLVSRDPAFAEVTVLTAQPVRPSNMHLPPRGGAVDAWSPPPRRGNSLDLYRSGHPGSMSLHGLAENREWMHVHVLATRSRSDRIRKPARCLTARRSRRHPQRTSDERSDTVRRNACSRCRKQVRAGGDSARLLFVLCGRVPAWTRTRTPRRTCFAVVGAGPRRARACCGALRPGIDGLGLATPIPWASRRPARRGRDVADATPIPRASRRPDPAIPRKRDTPTPSMPPLT